MKIAGRNKLEDYKRKHADISSQVDSWLAEAKVASWQTPHDIKKRYASASFLKDNNVILNIKGNTYRLKIQVDYKNGIVLIKNIGTHEEYMKW
jgi:mRNA interferase HigB